ncbi:MAG: hypothetical protein KY468_16005 [Armatimonadetes bacterium]|nr:hypothetical protein [Armatimonadota bacterium]
MRNPGNQEFRNPLDEEGRKKGIQENPSTEEVKGYSIFSPPSSIFKLFPEFLNS